jgi:hypothetical protein
MYRTLCEGHETVVYPPSRWVLQLLIRIEGSLAGKRHVYKSEAGGKAIGDIGAPTRYVALKPSPNRQIAGNNGIIRQYTYPERKVSIAPRRIYVRFGSPLLPTTSSLNRLSTSVPSGAAQ